RPLGRLVQVRQSRCAGDRDRSLRRVGSVREDRRRAGVHAGESGAARQGVAVQTMRKFIVHLSSFIVFFFAAAAHANFREFQQLPVDPALDAALRHSADATLKAFPKLTTDNLAMSIIDVTKPDVMSRADYHGDAPFYPASVIKLFYMVEVYHQHKENDPDVPRALHEMIVVSDNDATAFLLDTITDTASGPELQGRALRKFIERRGV